jgi:hypothetical protein
VVFDKFQLRGSLKIPLHDRGLSKISEAEQRAKASD